MERDRKPTPGFTTDDLLAELEAMLAPAGEGMRTVEIAHALNISRALALKLVKLLDEQGCIARVRQRFIRFDGRETTATAYKLKSVRGEVEDEETGERLVACLKAIGGEK